MKPVIFAILAGLCWGVGEIYTKSALNSKQIGPMAAFLVRAMVTLPMTIGAYLLAARFWGTEVSNCWRDMSVGVWLRLIVGSGVLAGFAGVFFFYSGLSMPGGDISRLRPIAFSLAPASAVILGWLMLGEAMTVKKAAAVVLIVVGIVMLSGKSDERRSSPGTGSSAGA